ncbi:hypothetical protein [Clostridium folliculivorans]|uniref:DUF4825 domain-containing protein n=1 Tax=Clostridium folliculivorans TaxID=2886038 RepID=A0A9W6D9N7_9CLOT|nr:hypothetical protein [Clostridium folliculivorans]GKU24091.1 hypothetical protein CFOLD11_09170 [Clostridium folliculivorans]GKU30197.1 hypothetical protein CFB3_23040 [Clostridium folliculivorans]
MKLKVLILAAIFLFILSLYPVVKFFLPPGREYITSREVDDFTKQIEKENVFISSCKIYNFQGSLYFDYKLKKSSSYEIKKYMDNIFNISDDFAMSDKTLKKLVFPSNSNPKGLRILIEIKLGDDRYSYEGNIIRYDRAKDVEYNDNFKTWDLYKNNELINEFIKETY